jgi:large subunit ribosomal protein L29
MADKKELRSLSPDDLWTQLNDAREELMNLRFQQATGELTDHNRLRITRQQIARILTIINEKSRAENMEGEA